MLSGRGFPYPQKSAAGPWDRQKYPPGQSPFSGEPHPKMKSLHKVLAPPPKKEIVFPPGSVESQKAVKVKRKVLHSKDVGKYIYEDGTNIFYIQNPAGTCVLKLLIKVQSHGCQTLQPTV